MTRKIFGTIVCSLLLLAAGLPRAAAIVLTTTGVQTNQVAFDATTGGPDAATGPVSTIVLINNTASVGRVTVYVYDKTGNEMTAAGRELTIPPGAGLPITWRGIWKVKYSTSGDVTLDVAPSVIN